MGSIVLLWMTFAVGKYEFGEKRGYTLVAVFDSVAGLDAKAAARMAGVKIGTVEKVGLEDSRAKVTIRIYPEVKIQRGTKAMVKTLGLLGEKYVELVPPEISAKEAAAPEGSRYLQEGERIRSRFRRATSWTS
jgi:phospholipid/cholesterol/gamma-HCH transport system substrate-binding protein